MPIVWPTRAAFGVRGAAAQQRDVRRRPRPRAAFFTPARNRHPTLGSAVSDNRGARDQRPKLGNRCRFTPGFVASDTKACQLGG